jgi:predicted lipoprotein with Yx(FWY)xxD motif
MSSNITCLRRPAARRLLLGSLAAGAAAAIAACSSSSPSTAVGSPGRATASASSAAVVTISAKSVPGVGAILVNRHCQTLYLLTSEQGGKITCTKASGCTKFWPETLLASGMTAAKAGSGVQASMLGTVTDASGNLEVTYNHWPLYTFVKDAGHGAWPRAHGLRRHLVRPERIRQSRDQPCLLSGRRWPGGQGAAWAASRTARAPRPDTRAHADSADEAALPVLD